MASLSLDEFSNSAENLFQSCGLPVRNVKTREVRDRHNSAQAGADKQKDMVPGIPPSDPRSEGDGAEISAEVNTGMKVQVWSQKSGVQGEKKVKSKPTGKVEEKYAQLSPGGVRFLHEMKIKQMAQLRPKMENHRSRVADKCDILTKNEQLMENLEEKRQKYTDLETKVKFKEHQVPEILYHQKFQNDCQEIQRKVEEYEDISRKIHNDTETITQLIQEMESLSNETMAIKKNMKECNLMIEDHIKEIQPRTRELECPANDLIDDMSKINEIDENIEKWADGCQSLEKAVYMWRNKNDSLDEKMKQMVNNVSLRDQKATNIEEHVSFLNLKLEDDRKMTDHWEKITQWRHSNSLRKQQKEELWNHLQKHQQKMDHHQKSFSSNFLHSEEDFGNACTRKCLNSNIDNENIKHVVEDIESKFKNSEELGKIIQQDRMEISAIKDTLEAMNVELNQKCTKEVRYPRKQYRRQLEDLHPKLDRWSEEYKSFEVEHDQWIKKKSELEEKMKKIEQNVDVREEQIREIDYCINCLNKMIDAEEKMKEHTKMVAMLIRVCEEKKVTDSKWDDFLQKTEEENRNVRRLDKIREELEELKNQIEKWAKAVSTEDVISFLLLTCTTMYMHTTTQYVNSSYRQQTNRLNTERFRASFVETVSSYLSEINDFNTSNYGKSSRYQVWRFIPRSNVEIYQEKDRIERWSSNIEKRYQELKQKNEKHLGVIEYFSREIDSCDNDIKRIVSAWKEEKDIFDKSFAACVDKIKDQNELISKMEKRLLCLNFMLKPDELMMQHERDMKEFRNQMSDTSNRWNKYREEYNTKFKKFHDIKDKEKLIEILDTNKKYMHGRKQSCDNAEQRNLTEEVAEDITEINAEDVLKSILQMKETTDHLHEVMAGKIVELQKQMDSMDEDIRKKYGQLEKPLDTYSILGKNVDGKLKEIYPLIERVCKCEEKMQLGKETIQSWQTDMKDVEEKAIALDENPFNIRLDGFQQMKEECMTMMSKHKISMEDQESKWKDHLEEKEKYTTKVDQIKEYLCSIPNDARKLSTELRQIADSHAKELSDIDKKIDCCQNEMKLLDDGIGNLRNKMAEIECMVQQPRIFAIESVNPEHITQVFKVIGNWHALYEELQGTVQQWDKKMSKLEDNFLKWKKVISE